MRTMTKASIATTWTQNFANTKLRMSLKKIFIRFDACNILCEYMRLHLVHKARYIEREEGARYSYTTVQNVLQ